MKCARASNRDNALMSMADSLGAFNSAFTTVLAPPSIGVQPTPDHHTNAVTAVLQLEKNWLTPAKCVSLVDFLITDQSMTDVYLALIGDETICREWVQAQLKTLGVHVGAWWLILLSQSHNYCSVF